MSYGNYGNVLIIEDDYYIAQELSMIIQKNHFNLVGTLSSYDDLKKIDNEIRIDLVLSDINLKDTKDGIDCCKYLSEHNKNAKFAFITVIYDEQMLLRANELDFISYVPKPYKEADIFVMLQIFKNKYYNKHSYSIKPKDVVVLDNNFFLT